MGMGNMDIYFAKSTLLKLYKLNCLKELLLLLLLVLLWHTLKITLDTWQRKPQT